MAPFAQIYSSYEGNPRVYRALTIAALNKLDVTLVPDFDFSKQFSPEYKAKFPHGKVPALETPDGFKLSESLAITTYLASSGPLSDQLFGGPPTSTRSRALVLQWVSFADQELGANLAVIAGMVKWKYLPPLQAQYDVCVKEMERALGRLEAGILERKSEGGGGRWLVGESITLADVMVYGMLWYGMGFGIGESTRGRFPGVMGWFEGMWDVKEIREVFKETPMVKERITLEMAGVAGKTEPELKKPACDDE